jgi:uncharacterized protein YndB with AHSA1/START domain
MFLTEFHGTETVQLAADPTDVFDLLVDVERLPEWNERVDHVIESPVDPLAEGTEWVIEMHAMGVRWPSRSRALRVDHTAMVLEHRSATDDGNPSFGVWSWQVTPNGDGSTLTVTWAVHPRSFWRKLILARIRRGFLDVEVRASVAGVDDYLVAAHAGTTSSR